MLHYLQNIVDFITSISDFIISFFKNVVELVVLISEGAGIVTQMVIYMPVQYKAIISAFIAYYIIHTIKNLGG